MNQNKIKNEWKKYFNYDLELSDMKDFIRLEIYTMFFVLLFGTVVLIISKNNNIFVDKNYYLYLLSYFLFWIVSLLLGYLNKKYKLKFILFISLIIHPRFWGMTLFLGVILLYSFFEINFHFIFIIIYSYFLR